MQPLSPRDATMYWLSARTRNDMFLLYCFADTGRSAGRLRAEVAEKARRIPDLLVRVLDAPANIAYPRWAPCDFVETQVVDHALPGGMWSDLESALGELLADGLRAADRPWRLHLFRNVGGAPGFGDERALVAVLQMSHALADGRRGADLARALFSNDTADGARGTEKSGKTRPSAPAGRRTRRLRDLPAKAIAGRSRAADAGQVVAAWLFAAREIPRIPVAMARTMVRGVAAARARDELAELGVRGETPSAAARVAPNVLNGTGVFPAARTVRMIVSPSARLRVPGHTVTVVVLTAVSYALERHLTGRGEAAGDLRAQVPMAFTVNSGERNTYRDLSVDLAVSEPLPHTRAARIAADLAARRLRAGHPLQSAQDAVTAALPAPLLHRDVASWPLDVLPERVSGHTVVSSVHRGAADLVLGGGGVRFTAGFPALGSVMHLTHGVHTLGDRTTLSVHADPAVVPGLDSYVALLESAVDEVVHALGSDSRV